MRGKHHITIETEGLKFEFDIKRNITVIQGDSATGKTTLVDMINEYVRRGGNRGITFFSDVPCEVYTGSEDRWEYELTGMTGKIIFFDEDYRFIYTSEFADYLMKADNYFVFVTRKPLKNLPYSINEIYGIRTSGKYHFPEQIYHEFYPIYSDLDGKPDSARLMILVEDKKSSYQFFNSIVGMGRCISSEGNANLYLKMLETGASEGLLVIADGAAFGPYVENIYKYANVNGHIALYFPESFEWLVLKSGILGSRNVDEILSHPEDYIDSSEYASWESFFTALLIKETKDDRYKSYSKTEINSFYVEGRNRDRIMSVIPEVIRQYL